MTFTHLEVHSHFTLLGATASVQDLASRAAADGLTHLALSDTNALYGAVAFRRACLAQGIHPVIGLTLSVAAPGPVGALEAASRPEAAGPGHLVLLARDARGYRSLCRLSSAIQGRPERALLAARGLGWEDIASHRDGLICLSGGRMGWIERFLRAGNLAAAQAYAGRLAGIFDDDACLSLELHGPEDAAVAAEVAALGRRLGLATVAVQPIYCLSPEDAPALNLLAAIRENRKLEETREEEADAAADAEDGQEEGEETPNARPASPSPGGGGLRRATAGQSEAAPRGGLADASRLAAPRRGDGWAVHWLSPAEVAARFARFSASVAMAGEIAARCGEVLPDGRPIWPGLNLPEGQTPDRALAALAGRGLQDRYAPPAGPDGTRGEPPADARDRLARELAAINAHGFAPLFLIVADIVRFAREHDIPVSTRGSVANSLVAFCAGITTVDPLEHDLLFERFLNPARASPPDIDLDFCSRRRDEVLAYVRETYGAEHVALVGTVSTMRPQSAVRETGKAFGLPPAEIGRLADMMPGGWHPDPRRRDQRTLADVLPTLPEERHREVATAAWRLIGQPDHLSVHPGGLVITPGPLTDIAPVQWAPKGFLITQFEHGDVEALGLPKIDLLGIRALTVLADAAELVRRDRDPGFRLDRIPRDDRLTGDTIEHAETIGVFQCESAGARRTLHRLRGRSVADLAIANAFFKPGPAMGGMADAFVRRYRGEAPVTFLHPALAPILGKTRGVLIFQEQVLRLAREIAGLSWEQADLIRRGMSHFGADQMEAVRERFVAGCMRPPPDGPAFTRGQAQTLWEQIMPFAGYGFNQGHATAYADVSYRSAYLKAHYPAEFLCARLADWGGFHHPAIYMAEAIRLGCTVRPPHVNFSGEAFTLVRPAAAAREPTPGAILYMGLGQVRDLRRSAIRAIIAGRQSPAHPETEPEPGPEPETGPRPYQGVRDLLARVALQDKEAVHLIQCGALDGLAGSRAAMLAELEDIRRSGGPWQMAFALGEPEAPAEELAQRLAWEQHILGLPVSALGDPLALVRDRLPACSPLRRLPELRGRPATIAGVRLPGWTGGPGFFLGDGETFVIARSAKEARGQPAWRPLILTGRWVSEPFGAQRGAQRGSLLGSQLGSHPAPDPTRDWGWFQAETITAVEASP